MLFDRVRIGRGAVVQRDVANSLVGRGLAPRLAALDGLRTLQATLAVSEAARTGAAVSCTL